MQFQRVVHEGKTRWVVALTKWEASAFTVIGRNKKDPADHQAVRFHYASGRLTIWATDRTQLLACTSKEVLDGPASLECAWATTATSLKSVAQKARVTNLIFLPLDEPIALTGPKQELCVDGKLVAPEKLAVLDAPGDLLIEDARPLDAVFERLTVLGARAPSQHVVSGRFASTLAALAKATDEAEHWIVYPPSNPEAALAYKVGDEMDGAAWLLALAPLVPLG